MTEHRAWFASYPPDVPHTLEPYPDISVFGMLEASARKHPNLPAIAWLGRKIPFATLLQETERCSAALAGLGVGKGDRVALLMPNCPQFVMAYYAATRLGAIAVGNNVQYTKREMEHQLRDCAPKVVIVLDLVYSDFADVFEAIGIEHVVVARLNDYLSFPKKQLAPVLRFKKMQRERGKPWPPVPKGAAVRWWEAWLRPAVPVPVAAQVDPVRDPAAFVYTGGTTGVSKGAMISHRNLVANAMQGAAYLGLREGEEGLLGSLPFFHSFGMLVMNVAILVAGKLTPIPNPRDLHMVLEQIDKEKPTFVPGVPRLFTALNESPLAPKYDLRSVRACISGGAPLPTAVADRFAKITGGATLVEGYGLTEATPVTHANPLHGERRPGSIGLPVPDTDCKIVDLEDPDRQVGPGERGELCVRGPQVMLGYWNRPDETSRTVINGWLHTGDVAIMDPDGYFRIVDRLKELVIVSGFNVYPNEVEEVLYHHPKVSKAAVIGIPDERTGEAVKAFVVLKEGESATPEQIMTWARDPANGLTGYRVPKQIEFRDSLPETMIGKVLRRVLMEEERQKAAAAKSGS
ncbi:MAG TPA: long-chain fatty acid--CoA ligase [Actinomycetota bacterium]|nr:long-chain fatty acid--CoA ligase [Actinomycetota bacterium]